MFTIELDEHRTTTVPRAWLTLEQGTELFQRHARYLDIAFPSPRTGGQWELTSNGYVGALVLDGDTRIIVRPKVPVANLAQMLWWAYDLPIDTFGGLVRCGTVPELYEQLVRALVERVAVILRQGPYHRYQRTERDLSAVRGRINVARHMRRPARIDLPCDFDERTADVTENRILFWALDRIVRSQFCSEPVQRQVRQVHRQLQGVSLTPIGPADWSSLAYDRLSERYRPAHALCRLLLENAGAVAERGESETVPFLLNMPGLFERFVTRWLAAHLPTELELRPQERSTVGDHARIDFIIDLVLYRRGGEAVCVLDTKYKDVAAPAAQDVAQVGYYALLKGCSSAGLVYPVPARREWQGEAGAVQTFRSTFDLSGDLGTAGATFRDELLRRLASTMDTVQASAHAGAVRRLPGGRGTTDG